MKSLLLLLALSISLVSCSQEYSFEGASVIATTNTPRIPDTVGDGKFVNKIYDTYANFKVIDYELCRCAKPEAFVRIVSIILDTRNNIIREERKDTLRLRISANWGEQAWQAEYDKALQDNNGQFPWNTYLTKNNVGASVYYTNKNLYIISPVLRTSPYIFRVFKPSER